MSEYLSPSQALIVLRESPVVYEQTFYDENKDKISSKNIICEEAECQAEGSSRELDFYSSSKAVNASSYEIHLLRPDEIKDLRKHVAKIVTEVSLFKSTQVTMPGIVSKIVTLAQMEST
jgi:hypothetical protein